MVYVLAPHLTIIAMVEVCTKIGYIPVYHCLPVWSEQCSPNTIIVKTECTIRVFYHINSPAMMDSVCAHFCPVSAWSEWCMKPFNEDRKPHYRLILVICQNTLIVQSLNCPSLKFHEMMLYYCRMGTLKPVTKGKVNKLNWYEIIDHQLK